MTVIKIFTKAGKYAENKDVARDIRLHEILPALQKRKSVILDFDNVEVATQSFIHALISDVIQQFGSSVLDTLEFKSCNDNVKNIIEVVITYVQDNLEDRH